MELLEAPIISYFMLNLLESKYKKRYVYLAYFIASLLIRAILTPVWGKHYIRTTATIVLFTMTTIFLFKDKTVKKILIYLLFIFCDLVGEIIAIFIVEFVFKMTINMEEIFTFTRVTSQLFCYSLVFAASLISIRIVKRGKLTFDEKTQYYIIAYAVAVLINLIIDVMPVQLENPHSPELVAAIITSVTTAAAFALLIYLNMINNMKAYRNHEFLLQEASLRDRHYEELKKQYESFRRIRHDFNAHINALDVLQAKGETREVTKYIARMKEEFAAAGTVKYSNIPILDAILFAEKEEADERGIETEFKTAGFAENSLSDYELCSLVANMLSKAMKSAQEYAGKKFISLDCFDNGGSAMIKVRNSADPPQKKEEQDIGEEIVRSIVKKNGGSVSSYYKDNVCEYTADLCRK